MHARKLLNGMIDGSKRNERSIIKRRREVLKEDNWLKDLEI
jgi:hypothetical protein